MADFAEQLKRYDPKAVATVKYWVEFCTDIIAVEPDQNPDRLRQAVNNLAQAAQVVYPQLELGEPVSLGPEELGDWHLPDKVADIFIRLTGDVLFTGVDGPLATAPVLLRALENIEQKVKEHANEAP